MKKMPLLLTTLFALAGLILTACSGGTSAPIVGEWELLSYGEASSPTPALPEVDTSISFDENGQFGGNVGCNFFGGEYKVSGDQITFDSIASTQMYCEATAEQESAVLGILSNSALKFRLDGNLLTITSAEGASVVALARK